jgi:hypothetical protein
MKRATPTSLPHFTKFLPSVQPAVGADAGSFDSTAHVMARETKQSPAPGTMKNCIYRFAG